jgi:hypothetical protein
MSYNMNMQHRTFGDSPLPIKKKRKPSVKKDPVRGVTVHNRQASELNKAHITNKAGDPGFTPPTIEHTLWDDNVKKD